MTGFSKPNAIETGDGGHEQLISNGERFKGIVQPLKRGVMDDINR